jgi:predicted RNA-binding protein (virulence factor B family)
MIKIGQLNRLRVKSRLDSSVCLDGGESGEILLPTVELPEGTSEGAEIEVFIYLDSSQLPVATTFVPKASVGQISVLEVVAVETVGAFLDWGLEKDLFLPFAEQLRPLQVGDNVIAALYIDKSGRLAASMRAERHLSTAPPVYEEGDAVSLLILGQTDLGFKAIVDGQHLGMIYENERFSDLHYGQRIPGFIKKMRPDGKIDLSLYKTGHASAQDIGPRILQMLKEQNGFLALNAKTSAEEIYDLFGVSKKKYKIVLGGLYKNRLITVAEDGIRLVVDSAPSTTPPASKPTPK